MKGERTFITLVFRVVLSGAHTRSTEYEFEYEFEKSFITLGPDLKDFYEIFSEPFSLINYLI